MISMRARGIIGAEPRRSEAHIRSSEPIRQLRRRSRYAAITNARLFRLSAHTSGRFGSVFPGLSGNLAKLAAGGAGKGIDSVFGQKSVTISILQYGAAPTFTKVSFE